MPDSTCGRPCLDRAWLGEKSLILKMTCRNDNDPTILRRIAMRTARADHCAVDKRIGTESAAKFASRLWKIPADADFELE